MKNKLINTSQKGFTVIANEVARNESLSWKARGIFLYLASHSSNWTFTMANISKASTEGLTSLKSGIKELEDAGLLHRERVKDENGMFTSMKWVIHQSGFPSDGLDGVHKNNNTSSFRESKENYVKWVDLWNELFECDLRITDGKRKQINARLKRFSEEEIKKALHNRKNSGNLKSPTKWDAFWVNDEYVEGWLTKETKHQQKLEAWQL